MSRRILVSRTDRAGDLILTTPVLREIRRAAPDAFIAAHVRSYTGPILSGNPWIDMILPDDQNGREVGLLDLAKQFRKLRFTDAVIVHPHRKVILAALLAGIPMRTGRASNIFQIFLNNRVIQNRSQNLKHEFEYNLDLVAALGMSPDYAPPRLTATPGGSRAGRERLDREGFWGIRPLVVHPGDGGSAFNLPVERYLSIMGELLARKVPFIVTIGPGEERIREVVGSRFPAGKIALVSDVGDLEMLMGLFEHCSGFIGGSTGPLHIAAALEKPVLAFFPPVMAMTPKRWGPVGNESCVLVPSFEPCNGRCSKCPHEPCMAWIDYSTQLAWFINVTQA